MIDNFGKSMNRNSSRLETNNSDTGPSDIAENPVPRAHEHRHRVVALINPVTHCRSTCVELLNAGVNLVGIVEAETKTRGLPLRTFGRLARKQGITPTLSQVAARLVYSVANRSTDRRIYAELFDKRAIEGRLSDWAGPVIRCQSYSEANAMRQLQNLSPDILVVHSQTWVGKQVRQIPSTGLVIGGHPGITPSYRGSHSSFWALLHQQPDMIGWTTFHVDKGVDTGDVIVQGRLEPREDDSYMTLNWKGMTEIARAQAAAILQFDRTGEIPRHAHPEIPSGSEFGLPTLSDYRRYRQTQSAVR